MKRPARLIVLLLPALVLAACAKSSAPKTETPKPAPAPSATSEAPAVPAPAPVQRGVKTEMRNVKFHLTDQAAAHLEMINGELWPTGKNEMPNFDDKTSFEFRVASGKVSITPRSLAAILNGYVFAKSDAPLKDLSIAVNGDRLIIKGKLHKGDISFETAGTLSVTPDGRIRVATEKVKALHVPVKGMMGLFGIELAKIVNTSKIVGMDTDKNDLLMDLGTLLPPPHIRGKLTAVKLEPNAIVTWFGDAASHPEAKPAAGEETSYMWFQGNSVRFGKITMQDADLKVLNVDPADELDWNQDHYREQLAAGYAKTTPSLGLRAYVKGYDKLPRNGAAATSASPPPGGF